MFLLVLDKNPVKAAELVPDKLKFKQLLELCQLICSAGISNVYKPIKQGKELQVWVNKHRLWIYRYYKTLWFWCIGNTNLKSKTLLDTYLIKDTLWNCVKSKKRIVYPKTVIFRYSKNYECNIPTNTELPINECIEEYTKYVQWKKENNVKGYI